MSSQENDGFLEEELDEEYDLENEDEEALLAEDDSHHRLSHNDEVWQEESYDDGESAGQEEDFLDLGASETLEEEDVLERHSVNNNLSPIKSANLGKERIQKTEITEDEFLQMGASKEDEGNKKEDSDDEEEEEDTEGRGRFRLERTNTVSAKVARERQSIPDTLDSVQVTDQPALNVGRRNNRRGVGPRMRARGRGMHNGRRPDHHMFGRQFQPHQQYPRPMMRPGPFPHQPLGVPENIPSVISQPHDPNINNMLNDTPSVAQSSPQKILINPHFKGPLPGRPQFWVPQETQHQYPESRYPPENSMPPNSQMMPPHYMQPPPQQVQSLTVLTAYTDVQYNQPQGTYQQQEQQQQAPVEMNPSWGSRDDNYASPQYHPPARHHTMQHPPPQSHPHYSGIELSPNMPPPAFHQPPPARMQQQAHGWPPSQIPQHEYQYGNTYTSPPVHQLPPAAYPGIQPPPRYPPPLRPQHPQQVAQFQPQLDYSVPPPSFQGESNNYHIAPQVSPRTHNIMDTRPVQHQTPPALMQQRPLQSQPVIPHQVPVRPLMNQQQRIHQQGQKRQDAQQRNPPVQQHRVPVHQRLQKNFSKTQLKPAQKRQNPVIPVHTLAKQPKLAPVALAKDALIAESCNLMPEKVAAEVANSTGMTVQELHSYTLKIREQKLLREEVLRRKEERRRQLIEEKQQLEVTGEKQEVQGNAIATIVNRSTVEPSNNNMANQNIGLDFEGDLPVPIQTSPIIRGRGSLQGRGLKRCIVPAQQTNVQGGRGKLGSQQRGRGAQSTRWLGRGAVRGAARGAAPSIIKTKGTRGPGHAATPTAKGAMKGVRGGVRGKNVATPGKQTQPAKQRGGMATQKAGRGHLTTNNSVLKTIVPGEKVAPGRVGQVFRGRGRTVVMNSKINTDPGNAAQPQQSSNRRVVQSAPAQATAVAPTKVQNLMKPTSSTIIIENLSTATSKQTLLKMSETLKVQKIIMDQGIATLTFASVEGAAQFYQKYNRKMVDLSLVTVKYA